MKKKFMALFISLFIIANHSVSLFAGSLSLTENKVQTVEGFEITGGIDTTKDMEITFDRTKVISGTAKKGTSVTFNVYEVSGKGENRKLFLMEQKDVVVGPSGIYSQLVKLSVGENQIEIVADDGNTCSTTIAVVKCKRSELKKELQNNIALPGQLFAQFK